MAFAVVNFLLFLASLVLQWAQDLDVSQYHSQALQAAFLHGYPFPLNVSVQGIKCSEPYGRFRIENDFSRYIFCYNGEPEIFECDDSSVFLETMGCIDPEIFINEFSYMGNEKQHHGNFRVEWECNNYTRSYALQRDCTKYMKCKGIHMEVISCPEGMHFKYDHCERGIPDDCFTVYSSAQV